MSETNNSKYITVTKFSIDYYLTE